MHIMYIEMVFNHVMRGLGEQGRRSSDCTRFQPLWPGFDFGFVAI